jgi:hypothetical protein
MLFANGLYCCEPDCPIQKFQSREHLSSTQSDSNATLRSGTSAFVVVAGLAIDNRCQQPTGCGQGAAVAVAVRRGGEIPL